MFLKNFLDRIAFSLALPAFVAGADETYDKTNDAHKKLIRHCERGRRRGEAILAQRLLRRYSPRNDMLLTHLI